MARTLAAVWVGGDDCVGLKDLRVRDAEDWVKGGELFRVGHPDAVKTRSASISN
jgi:hypothetical protein